MDVTKGVNVPRLFSTAFLYSFFFSRAPVSKIDSGVRCRCDGASSVSMTFISNNAEVGLNLCIYKDELLPIHIFQTPKLGYRSTINRSEQFVGSGSV